MGRRQRKRLSITQLLDDFPSPNTPTQRNGDSTLPDSSVTPWHRPWLIQPATELASPYSTTRKGDLAERLSQIKHLRRLNCGREHSVQKHAFRTLLPGSEQEQFTALTTGIVKQDWVYMSIIPILIANFHNLGSYSDFTTCDTSVASARSTVQAPSPKAICLLEGRRDFVFEPGNDGNWVRTTRYLSPNADSHVTTVLDRK